MKIVFWALCLGLLSGRACCQDTRLPSEDLRFSRHLIENELYKDAVYVLKKQLTTLQKADDAVSDSLNYYIGWSYFNMKSLDSSCLYFSRIKSGAFYPKASFYSVFSNAYLKRTKEAKDLLDSIRTENDSSQMRLQNLQFAGIALLERDYQAFEKRAKQFTYSYFSFAEEEKKITDHYAQLKKVKNRSPFLAGVFSAILPGSGKFYAGYRGQAVAAFMTVGILGISAAESYYRLGPKSAQFITFGSLFTIFYAGNIWGSVVSVKLARNHQLTETDDQILFDMHIPLRKLFN